MSRIRVRDNTSLWRDEDDGSVTLIVRRRIMASMGGVEEHEFNAATEAGALALYDEFCIESGKRSVRQAERRARWGPG